MKTSTIEQIEQVQSMTVQPMPKSITPSRPLVVVLEDDYRMAMALVMLINDWGFAGVAGRSLVEITRTLGPRLENVSAIVTDVNLNGSFRGIKDAKFLASAIGHGVPTIVTTGYGDFAEESGSFPVLRKPFDPGVLRRWLDLKVRNIGATD
jgi:FixJ family two-component response regulator